MVPTIWLILLLRLASLVSAASFTNPMSYLIAKQPYVVFGEDGYWYYMYTSYWEIKITRATSLDGLKQQGQNKTIIPKLDNDRNYYNPKLYKIDNVWWIYFTATPDPQLLPAERTQDFYALKGGATVPDKFSNPVKIANRTSGQLLRFEDRLYFISSCGKNICIAPMGLPTSIGTSAILAVPDQMWERTSADSQPLIGSPTPFYHNGKIFIAYDLGSMAWMVENTFGLLTYKGSGDPMAVSSWTKTGPHQNAAYTEENTTCYAELGTFFPSPDDSEVWSVYNTDNVSNGCRVAAQHTGAKRLGWNLDGSPDFGVPDLLWQTKSGPSGEWE